MRQYHQPARRAQEYFNPRTPCGVRRKSPEAHGQPQKFQSTHPVRGATGYRCKSYGDTNNFNPRTPCGVRQDIWRKNCASVVFQSTHPVRGATRYTRSPDCFSRSFQSTHPVRGATNMPELIRIVQEFQSTHPVRGATKYAKTATWLKRFQSTHPVRGATDVLFNCYQPACISIHAPRAGCDQWPEAKIEDGMLFQSTHPVRGATRNFQDAIKPLFDFNPRTPCGVRQRAVHLP